MRNDSGLHGELWRHNGRNAEHGGNVPSLVVVAADAPREALIGFWMAGDGEHLNVTLPSDFSPENLFDGHRLDVRGIAAVNGFDGFTQF